MVIKTVTCFICEEGTVYFRDKDDTKVCPECEEEFTVDGEVFCKECDGFGGFDLGGGDSADCIYCKGSGWVAHDYNYEVLTKEDIRAIKGDIKYHEMKDEGLI